jgi:hypothetical protein
MAQVIGDRSMDSAVEMFCRKKAAEDPPTKTNETFRLGQAHALVTKRVCWRVNLDGIDERAVLPHRNPQKFWFGRELATLNATEGSVQYAFKRVLSPPNNPNKTLESHDHLLRAWDDDTAAQASPSKVGSEWAIDNAEVYDVYSKSDDDGHV